ncbi:single-strand DNA-binding protein [Leucobacter exalbidus]|uniref:Single-stranded DNA-binding protein n=1 Tax=Leucobacter exalbidus TaxID=662960 RepID=A0A940PRP0_9MICO|nr:single-stranded DNA-binding protein [Leucobacter exalbidus]MBP1325528.1 single-strand DNA-binding protein [Leucobacter exalbidus]
MHTQVCVVGTVATDPKFTHSAEKTPFCSFRLACNERRYDAEKKEWIDADTNWFTVNSFRGLAAHAFESFQKGDRVVVNGRLRMRDWSNDEKSGTSVIVDADALGHDLRWGTSTFTKASTPPTGQVTVPTQASPVAAGEPQPWGSPAAGAQATAAGTEPAAAEAESFEADGFTPKDELTPAM